MAEQHVGATPPKPPPRPPPAGARAFGGAASPAGPLCQLLPYSGDSPARGGGGSARGAGGSARGEVAALRRALEYEIQCEWNDGAQGGATGSEGAAGGTGPDIAAGACSLGAAAFDYSVDAGAYGAAASPRGEGAPLRVVRNRGSDSAPLERSVGVALARHHRAGYVVDRSPMDGGLARASSLLVLPRHRSAPALPRSAEPAVPRPKRAAPTLPGPTSAPGEARGEGIAAAPAPAPAPAPESVDAEAAIAHAAFPADQAAHVPAPLHAAHTHRKPPPAPLPPPAAACRHAGGAAQAYIKHMRGVWEALAAQETPGAIAVPGSDPWGARGIWGAQGQATAPRGCGVSATLLAHRMEQMTVYFPSTIPPGPRPKAREAPKL